MISPVRHGCNARCCPFHCHKLTTTELKSELAAHGSLITTSLTRINLKCGICSVNTETNKDASNAKDVMTERCADYRQNRSISNLICRQLSANFPVCFCMNFPNFTYRDRVVQFRRRYSSLDVDFTTCRNNRYSILLPLLNHSQ